ncbi:hypothetical protein ACFYZ3_22435 [Streptomyces sp. NPDC001599]|uniref:hypothetical protein n=1 Tax=Streptomyces sp. NPDC001599 TaxID=3364591 RepID=UPI00367446E3
MTETRPPTDSSTSTSPLGAPRRPDTPDAADTPLHGALGEELLLVQAQSAARSGDLAAARRLLEDVTGSSAAPPRDVLDLLARVHAQCGEFEEADRCWERVQAADPQDRDAAAGRALVARIRSGRSPARPRVGKGARLGAVALVAACAASFAGVALADAFDSPSASDSTSAEQRADRATARADRATRRAEKLAARVAELEDGAGQRRGELAAQVAGLDRALSFPGVRVERHTGSVRVVFQEALFVGGEQLTPEGAAALAELGRRLAGQDATVKVVGHVAAVPGADVSGGSPLALWRAMVAVRTLSDHSGRPLSSFTTAGGDARHAPHRDIDLNRTVTLTVAPTP